MIPVQRLVVVLPACEQPPSQSFHPIIIKLGKDSHLPKIWELLTFEASLDVVNIIYILPNQLFIQRACKKDEREKKISQKKQGRERKRQSMRLREKRE